MEEKRIFDLVLVKYGRFLVNCGQILVKCGRFLEIFGIESIDVRSSPGGMPSRPIPSLPAGGQLMGPLHGNASVTPLITSVAGLGSAVRASRRRPPAQRSVGGPLLHWQA